ncbi:hypothetical protein GYMLUDRAFT_483391 [Collybiopsis luxurians FD-317 M1]|uniref:Uncharacterized protein n=1 Tax=Collybiopsis luxurians FD-317 M1 TaxID=944289 RepID=A0A0D0D1T1_9AGAR|nr:hypothetical protein GYMLUDRAFT_483391 [Collybiopsis luxurians FD-317 M1]
MSTDLLDSEYITGTVVPCTIVTFFLYGQWKLCMFEPSQPIEKVGIPGLYSLLFYIYIQIQTRNTRSHQHRRPIFFRMAIPALFFLISLGVILSTVSLYELLNSQILMDLVSGERPLSEPDAHYFGFWNFDFAAIGVFNFSRCSYNKCSMKD